MKLKSFLWNSKADLAFQKLKTALTSTPVLKLPDFSAIFVIETDASIHGVGAVLSQKGHPLAYFSKKLSPKMANASAYVRELYAITQAVAKWRHYLLGKRFLIKTDKQSLKELMSQTVQTPEQQYYLTKLLGYEFDIEYRTGNSNAAADALSRILAEHFHTYTALEGALVSEVRLANQSDQELLQLHELAQQHQLPNDYSIQHGIVLFKNKIFLPRSSPLIAKIIFEFHATPLGGHQGVLKTFKRITEQFHWKGLQSAVEKFVASCLTCQQTKYMSTKTPGTLQPLPIPSAPWTELSMDFIVGLPLSAGYSSILVVVDRLTKVAHFSALKSGFTAKTIAEVFLDSIVKHHGFPHGIVSDRDPIFLSTFWQQIMSYGGTKLHYSTAYHPQSDGQTEVVNRCLEQYLRAFTFEQPSKWHKYLPWAELCYNTTFHRVIGMTPHQALYGYNPKLLPTYTPGSATADEADITLIDRQQIQQQLQAHIAKAQQRMKKYADSKRKEQQYAVGQWVWAKFHHYKQQSVAKRLNFKLAKRYFGPFLILDRVGPVAYKLKLPPGSKIHPVLHVSLLKEYKGPIPPTVINEDVQLAQPTLP